MKRQSIFLILLLLQVLFICVGCGSSEKAAKPLELTTAAEEEAAAVTEEAAAAEEAAVAEAATPAEASFEAEDIPLEANDIAEEFIADRKSSDKTIVEDAIGIFEGLEDNHTAIFSFDGAETAFFFEDPAVRNVLFEAVLGSSYTLSYQYDDSTGYVIYKISE